MIWHPAFDLVKEWLIAPFLWLILGIGGAAERPVAVSHPWEGSWAPDSFFDGFEWGNFGAASAVNPRTLARQTNVGLIGWQVRGGMSIDFALVHNSMATRSNTALGVGEWLHSYDIRLVLSNGNTRATIEWAHLKQELDLVNGGWVAADGYRDTLAALQTGGSFLLTTRDQTRYTFEATGDPAVHRLKSIKDTSNNAVTLIYNATTGKLTQVKDPNARAVKFAYNAQTGRLSNIKFAAGAYIRQWNFTYNANGRLNKITWPTVTTENGPQSYAMLLTTDAASNNLTAITDREGHEWQFGYSGDLAAWAQAPGNNNAQRTLYAIQGPDHRMTDPDGVAVRSRYDGMHRLVHCLDGAGNDTSFVYGDADYAWAPSAMTAATGEVWAWDLDNDGLAVGITPPGLGRFDLTYNTRNRLTRVRQPLVTDADGQTESTRRRTDYFYDSRSRLIKVREYTSANAFADSLLLTYSAQGLPITSTNALNQTTTYTYDARGNLASATTPAGRVFTWDFPDEISTCGYRVPRAADTAGGPSTEYVYDELARLRARVQADASGAEYHYDGLDRLVKVHNAIDEGLWYFSPNGYCDMTTDGGGWTAVYARTAAGRLMSMTETGAFGQQSVTYAYDAFGRCVQKSDGGQFTYSYDGAGRLVQSMLPNGQSTQYSYLNGRLGGKSVSVHAIVKYEWDFDYNAAGGLIRRSEMIGGEQAEFFTDLRNRLTRETVTGPFNHTVQYAYDNAGRRIGRTTDGNQAAMTYDADGLVQSLSAPNTVYGWDPAGRMTSIQDMNGQRTFGWDDAGRMTEAVSPIGRDEYQYDSLNRRARYREKDANGMLLSDSAYRYLGGTLRRQERTVGGNTIQGTVSFGPGGLELWQDDWLAPSLKAPVIDNAGTRALFDVNGDQVPFAAVYDAFGRTIEHSGSDAVYQWGADAGIRTEGSAGIIYNGHAGLGASGWFEPESGSIMMDGKIDFSPSDGWRRSYSLGSHIGRPRPKQSLGAGGWGSGNRYVGEDGDGAFLTGNGGWGPGNGYVGEDGDGAFLTGSGGIPNGISADADGNDILYPKPNRWGRSSIMMDGPYSFRGR